MMDLVSDPFSDLVPPWIFLAITVCLMIRSAGLLSDDTLGNLTKTNSSGMKVIIRAQSVLIGMVLVTYR